MNNPIIVLRDTRETRFLSGPLALAAWRAFRAALKRDPHNGDTVDGFTLVYASLSL